MFALHEFLASHGRPKSMQVAFFGVVSGLDFRFSGSHAAYFDSKIRAETCRAPKLGVALIKDSYGAETRGC